MRLSFYVMPFFCMCATVTSTVAQEQPFLNKQRVKAIKFALNNAADEVDRLQEDVTEELSGVTKKEFYRTADDLLSELLTLHSKVSSGMRREDLYQHFETVEDKVSRLAKSVKATKNRSLNRAAVRLWHADLELHFHICYGDRSPRKAMEVLQRQLHAYALTAQKLDQSANSLLTGPTAASIRELAKTIRKLDLANKDTSLKEIKKQFQSVNVAWENVVNRIKLLPPSKNVYLLRGAARLDRLHGRMFRLLEMTGRRPVFTFRI